MDSASKTELIACLRSQLQRAEERQRRWEQLGSVMRTTNAKSWNTIAILRQEEVEQFRVLLEWAEKEDLPQKESGGMAASEQVAAVEGVGCSGSTVAVLRSE